MEGIQVSDIMIPLGNYPHIPYWFTLRQAMVEMEKFEIEKDGRKSLPRIILVFDEQYQLLGMVRRRDIMRGLEPSYFEDESSGKNVFGVEENPNMLEESYERIADGLRERAERPVRDVMIPIMRTLEYDDNILTVIYEMVENNMSLIPVLQEGQVVGVVRSVDVLHQLAKIVL